MPRAVGCGGCLRPPLTGSLRDPSNVSGDLRQLLDSFECESCTSTGYQLEEDGSSGAGRRIRCEEGPWSWVTSHTSPSAGALTPLRKGAGQGVDIRVVCARQPRR
jgi:hypothetical protein